MYADLCYSIDVYQVCVLWIFYLSLCAIFRKYTKNKEIASNIVSNVECWYFVLSLNMNSLISYYWYDLGNMIIQKSWVMVAHHIFTLYALFQCPSYPDYTSISNILIMVKTSDLLIHHYHIVHACELDKKYPFIANAYNIVTLIITCVAWITLRVFYTISHFPLIVPKSTALLTIFTVLNTYWVVKMSKLIKKISSKLWIDVTED